VLLRLFFALAALCALAVASLTYYPPRHPLAFQVQYAAEQANAAWTAWTQG